jgi:hypothetical protein
MERHSIIQECPDVLAPERASDELVKRIRKLRWIGMDDEAEQLIILLRRFPAPKSAETVLTGPSDTD